MALEVKLGESRRIWPKRKRGKCKIYLPPSALSLSTPTAQASSVPGLADGLGIVLVRRDKAIMIVTVYFRLNFPAGNPEFKKKKRMSRKNGVSFNASCFSKSLTLFKTKTVMVFTPVFIHGGLEIMTSLLGLEHEQNRNLNRYFSLSL